MLNIRTTDKFSSRLFSSNNHGFTLLEMTVSLGIFIILFTLALGIYSYTLKAEQRTVQISKLQNEAQLIMEFLANTIRRSKVDYAYYGGSVDPNNGEDTLALLDKNGQQIVFYYNSTGETLQVCTQDCSGSGSFISIPSQEVTIQILIFFISPASDPFSLSAPPSEFPRITVVIKLRISKGNVNQDLLIQQTIPQRLAGP